MYARDVKDLSIALEALSRIAGYDAMTLFDRIRKQLDMVIDKLELETMPTPPSSPLA